MAFSFRYSHRRKARRGSKGQFAKRRSRIRAMRFGRLPILGSPVYKSHRARFPRTRVAERSFAARNFAKMRRGGLSGSYRPRLYIEGGKVFASPLSDTSLRGYRVNPRRHAMRHMTLFRSHRRRYRHNPAALRAVMSKDNLFSVVGITGGFIAGVKGGKFIYSKVPAAMRRFAGLITFALGTIIAVKVRNNLLKKAGVGVAASGVYDLLSQNIPALGLMPIAGIDLSMPHTPRYAGEDYDIKGDTQLIGNEQDGDTIDVSGETVLVGDEQDGDGVYANI